MTSEGIRMVLLAGIGGAALVSAFFLFRWSPKTLMVVWALVFFFIPIWVGLQKGVFFSAITIVTLLVIATSSTRRIRLSIVDLLVALFVLLLLAAWLMHWVTWGHLLIALVGWMVPYVGGRLIASRVGLHWIYSCLAAGAVAASVLAIVEFLTGVNFFVLLKMPNSLYTTWAPLQYRGGLMRVEGAFGHSIALGACLAMCSVFILVVRWPQWLRLVSLMILVLAVGLTFSRIGVIGLVLTVIVALLTLGRAIMRATRTAVIAVMAVAAVVGIPLLLRVFVSAGEEASGSADYRSDIYALVYDMSALGITSAWRVLPGGETYYGSFQSIDSEVVLSGLRFGLIPSFLLLAMLACCVISVIRGRATPSTVALIGQIPAFATVALSTQYASLVWFLAGLAVASYALPHVRPEAHLSAAIPPSKLSPYREEHAWLR